MENLNREAILRMLSGKTGNSSSGGGGGDIDLAGYATSIWVTENFVSIDFFRELFRAFDSNSQEILPNDTTSVVASIKAMVGTWTEEYLTALGNAGGGGGGGGGGGAQYLNDLLDVQLTTPLTDGQALVFNATLQKWVNGAAGVNMTTVWNALAGSTNEQINASHLSTALSGYVTTSAISDMATQTWVGQQGFATQTWVTSNFITIAYFDRLFRAYNGSTLVSHNDTTSTIDNIKAMFGFWTDFYLSALGTGGVSSVSISLSQLADVTLTSPTGGQALVYDATSSKWVNGTIQTGVSTLSSLTDVLLTSPTANQVLIWDATSSKWVNTSLKTINFQSIIGSGDISVGGGASGNYLPLTGGTVYNTSQSGWLLNVQSDHSGAKVYAAMSHSDGYGMFLGTTATDSKYLFMCGSGMTNIGGGNVIERFKVSANGNVYVRDRLGIGIESPNRLLHLKAAASDWSLQTYNSYSGSSTSVLIGHREACMWAGLSGSSQYNYIMALFNNLNGETDGTPVFYVRGDGNVGVGTNSPTYKLTVTGTTQSADLYLSGLDCWIYNGSNTYGNVAISGNKGGYCGINLGGNDSRMSIMDSGDHKGLYQETSLGWIVYANGSSGFICLGDAVNYGGKVNVAGNFVASGAVTALSDIRHKTVIRDAVVSVEDIARMPAVMYQWNDGREDKELHVGSIAQNWQTVLPEVVLKANDAEGTLSMQYGVAALVSSIIIARKVVNHEERIKQLEKENKELKKRLNIA